MSLVSRVNPTATSSTPQQREGAKPLCRILTKLVGAMLKQSQGSVPGFFSELIPGDLTLFSMRSQDNRKLPNIIKEADAEAIRRYFIHPEGTSVFEALPSVNMYTEVQKALQEAKYAYPLMVTTGTQPLLLTGLEDKEALLLTYVATQADQKELDAAADRVIPMVNNLILHTSNNHASTD